MRRRYEWAVYTEAEPVAGDLPWGPARGVVFCPLPADPLITEMRRAKEPTESRHAMSVAAEVQSVQWLRRWTR